MGNYRRKTTPGVRTSQPPDAHARKDLLRAPLPPPPRLAPASHAGKLYSRVKRGADGGHVCGRRGRDAAVDHVRANKLVAITAGGNFLASANRTGCHDFLQQRECHLEKHTGAHTRQARRQTHRRSCLSHFARRPLRRPPLAIPRTLRSCHVSCGRASASEQTPLSVSPAVHALPGNPCAGRIARCVRTPSESARRSMQKPETGCRACALRPRRTPPPSAVLPTEDSTRPWWPAAHCGPPPRRLTCLRDIRARAHLSPRRGPPQSRPRVLEPTSPSPG